MLQILGEAMLIATRMDDRLNDHRTRPARPLPHEPAEQTEHRRGWLHLTGLLL